MPSVDHRAVGADEVGRHAPVAVDAQRRGGGVGSDPVDQVGLAQQRAAHRDELEPLLHGEVHRGAVGDPAEQDHRQRDLGAHPAGVVEQVGVLVGVLADEPACRPKRIAVLIGCGITSTNSSTGAPPRNRYIGLSSELPPVISKASTVPSASIQRAVWIASSRVMPPRTPSDMFSLVRIAIRPPTASRTARRMPRANRARFSREPPYSSLRWLIFGLRNALAR